MELSSLQLHRQYKMHQELLQQLYQVDQQLPLIHLLIKSQHFLELLLFQPLYRQPQLLLLQLRQYQ